MCQVYVPARLSTNPGDFEKESGGKSLSPDFRACDALKTIFKRGGFINFFFLEREEFL